MASTKGFCGGRIGHRRCRNPDLRLRRGSRFDHGYHGHGRRRKYGGGRRQVSECYPTTSAEMPPIIIIINRRQRHKHCAGDATLAPSPPVSSMSTAPNRPPPPRKKNENENENEKEEGKGKGNGKEKGKEKKKARVLARSSICTGRISLFGIVGRRCRAGAHV